MDPILTCPTFYYFCVSLGVFWFSRVALTIATCVISRIFARLRFDWSSLGKWAVITGGSDGIGKSYAEELARYGFKICLISRTSHKLKAAAEEIRNKYGVETKTLCIDFCDGPHIYDIIAENLKDLQIGVLVNNVGTSYRYPEYFHEVPGGLDFVFDLVRTNIVACTMMTRIVLPQMERRRKGVIINISSLTALYPMPLLNVYAAAKAYVDHFSRALYFEYKDKGIIVQSVLPGFVATKMSNRRVRFEVPNSDVFVQSAIKTIGSEYFTFGYFAHSLRGFAHTWLKQNMPTWINMAIALKYMKKDRKRYIEKQKFKMLNN